jgi:hypothetical protein
MNEILRETLRALRDAGFEPRIRYSRHIHVRFTDQQNRERLVVLSNSPGTTFARQKNRALLRRILRGQGPNGEGATR